MTQKLHLATHRAQTGPFVNVHSLLMKSHAGRTRGGSPDRSPRGGCPPVVLEAHQKLLHFPVRKDDESFNAFSKTRLSSGCKVQTGNFIECSFMCRNM
ncbi:hypothetical protein Mp_1g07260 [Marchantia polymorpha subsp. ruderalis]|uniref:Uncharacterized protein n=2 Tax=Marchantia polymorpha TaxID=3197 RepID=A0AAF6AMH7_MARPO|nr:hypothetical protein MARPO_0043s0119 [Marchantia polymorpha]PTQ39889.1 hypothetical protein MARPO_0043s0119 [Marchantia polymorpha]BBM97646.1 hypothetical protein Mp_1g07260 [Marchantia polymorpha subsp. ruderalis]BBM97647.1 hypothetical protein Mp_1g07260 [Marchantia polymorpha subsp. ruderalis]|eukprot:PTQ39888.1 hypothetical protein MARPO_0043s0119 [Marchantia polymorpha]